jgi:Mg-chelatase subunit ChlI
MWHPRTHRGNTRGRRCWTDKERIQPRGMATCQRAVGLHSPRWCGAGHSIKDEVPQAELLDLRVRREVRQFRYQEKPYCERERERGRASEGERARESERGSKGASVREGERASEREVGREVGREGEREREREREDNRGGTRGAHPDILEVLVREAQ